MAITSPKNIVLLTIAGAALLGAGVIAWTTYASTRVNPDFPDGHPYICLDCGEVTVLSDAELFELKAAAREVESLDAGRVSCRACGSSNTFPAMKCPYCGTYFARPGPGRPVCPHCQKPLPSPLSDD
jgi:hypothetical protein